MSGTTDPRGREDAVVVEGLTRRFNDTLAVDDLSFAVREGELFGIVGPDGAGKTTTLRMLVGVLRPSEGRISVAGIDTVDDPEAAKPRLAYMAQRFGLYDDLTVAENLGFYADLYRVPTAERPGRLERLYEFSRLGEFRDRLAGALSGGMKQKLALSCCLVHQPEVLFLDEPTFGVDPISRRELWQILEEMRAAGTTILLSTSYLEEAERCDRVALLNLGRRVALDTPDEVRSLVDGILLSLRVGSPREARDRLRAMEGVASATLFGESVHMLLDPGIDSGQATRMLDRSGVLVHEAETISPSLEDAFLYLVSGGA